MDAQALAFQACLKSFLTIFLYSNTFCFRNALIPCNYWSLLEVVHFWSIKKQGDQNKILEAMKQAYSAISGQSLHVWTRHLMHIFKSWTLENSNIIISYTWVNFFHTLLRKWFLFQTCQDITSNISACRVTPLDSETMWNENFWYKTVFLKVPTSEEILCFFFFFRVFFINRFFLVYEHLYYDFFSSENFSISFDHFVFEVQEIVLIICMV